MMIYLRKIYNCITRTRYNNKANGCAKKQNKVYLSQIHLNTQGGHKDGYEYCMPGSGRSTGSRDEPDYDKLMKWRLGILKEHGLGLKEIQETIAKIDPIPGAKEFLDELRSITQVIIISDTFSQFAGPLMKKLGYPTIFCNSLEVADNGEITGFKMRVENSKYTTVKALQSIGFQTIASGDSHNDLGMIQASKAGFLFKSTEQIKKDHPELPAYETYDELMAAIKKAL